MDALGRKACGRARTVKPCGPDPPTLGSSECNQLAMVANKPGHKGERGAAVKPLRRECRAISALPDDLWAFFLLAHEDCGCGRAPEHSLRPPASGGTRSRTSSGRIPAARTRNHVVCCRYSRAARPHG